MRGALLVLGMAAVSAAGCQSPVGRYFANRARDFGECWRVEVGAAMGLGVGVNAPGLAHVGLGGGKSSARSSLGWDYGHAFAFRASSDSPHEALIEFWLPLPLPFPGDPSPTFLSHVAGPSRLRRGSDDHKCVGWLPCVWDLASAPSVQDPWPRWRAIHAFDIEVAAYAGLLHARLGFSPGEFADFLLGWFGLDLAGDDSD